MVSTGAKDKSTNTTLTKDEMASTISPKIGCSTKEAKDFIDTFADLIIDKLAEGYYIKISGFGNFKLRHKAARPGRNPKTGEAVEISERTVVSFSSGSKLKVRLQEKIDVYGEGVTESDRKNIEEDRNGY